MTFSPAPSPSAFCAAWSTTSFPDLVGSNVVVHGTQTNSGDDLVTVTDTADCNGKFHFGSIDLGQAGYFTTNASFGGNVTGCNNGATTGCSTIHWDGKNTLTITLGWANTTQPTQTIPSVAVYSPTSALGFERTIASVLAENF